MYNNYTVITINMGIRNHAMHVVHCSYLHLNCQYSESPLLSSSNNGLPTSSSLHMPSVEFRCVTALTSFSHSLDVKRLSALLLNTLNDDYENVSCL